MGRWAEKYTQAQREAVGAAMLDPTPITGRQATAKEVVALLNAGRLGVPAPAEPMPHTTAYDCRNKERQRRAGHQLSPLARRSLEEPGTVKDDIIRRAVSLHEQQLQKLEHQQAKGDVDPRLYATFCKNTPIVLSLLRQPKANGKPQAPQAREEPPAQDDTTAQLLQAHAASSRGTSAAKGFVTAATQRTRPTPQPIKNNYSRTTPNTQEGSHARSATSAGTDSVGNTQLRGHVPTLPLPPSLPQA